MFDLIIVGAGPGGSNAAAVALRHGLRVAQFEALRMPRVKPCAGALTPKAARSLQFDLEPLLRRSHSCFEFNQWMGRGHRFRHAEPVLRMVYRPEFDAALVRQNQVHAGFTFFDALPVRDVRWNGSFAVQTSDGRTWTAAQLIGADGAYSLVNRTFRIARPAAVATAIEAIIPLNGAGQNSGIPRFDFGAVQGGYGWVFPKDVHVSAGLYTNSRRAPGLRQQLANYIRAAGLPQPEEFESHRVPCGAPACRVPPVPVYVVGDAAGLADSLAGEGIYHALESGRLAGETATMVHRGWKTHHSYYRRLRAGLNVETRLSYWAAGKFYGNLQKSFDLIDQDWIWRTLVEGYAAGATLTGCVIKSPYWIARSFYRRQASHERSTWSQ